MMSLNKQFIDEKKERDLLKKIFGEAAKTQKEILVNRGMTGNIQPKLNNYAPGRELKFLTKAQLIANVNLTKMMANNAAIKAAKALTALKTHQTLPLTIGSTPSTASVNPIKIKLATAASVNPIKIKLAATPNANSVSQSNVSNGIYNIKQANIRLNKLVKMWDLASSGMDKARKIRAKIESEIVVARNTTRNFLIAIANKLKRVTKLTATAVVKKPVGAAKMIIRKPIIRKPVIRKPVARKLAVRVGV